MQLTLHGLSRKFLLHTCYVSDSLIFVMSLTQTQATPCVNVKLIFGLGENTNKTVFHTVLTNEIQH